MSKIEKYLLDANLLIAALDKEGTTSEIKREEAKKMLWAPLKILHPPIIL